jgi:hypothetical protein
MSNQWDDDDDDYTAPEVNSDLVKQLRKANKQKEKELAELKAQFEGLTKAQRERAIKDTLTAKGVNSKIAAFIPGDIEPSEDAISKWLTDYADVFGFESAPQATPNVDPKVAQQYTRMTQAASQGLSPEGQEDILRRLMNADSRDELDKIIRETGL